MVCRFSTAGQYPEAQKCPAHAVFLIFLDVLGATTACTFFTSALPEKAGVVHPNFLRDAGWFPNLRLVSPTRDVVNLEGAACSCSISLTIATGPSSVAAASLRMSSAAPCSVTRSGPSCDVPFFERWVRNFDPRFCVGIALNTEADDVFVGRLIMCTIHLAILRHTMIYRRRLKLMLHRFRRTYNDSDTSYKTCYRHEAWILSMCAKLLGDH